MRKRTQLVGFEFGYWKHAQYVAEFLDNALDAVETFQWNELNKKDSNIKFTLDQELSLENLSIVKDLFDEEVEVIGSKENNNEKKEEIKKINKSKIEVEKEVQRIITDLNELLAPVSNIIDVEPIVIIRLRESEPPSFLTSELSQKNIMNYTFEIFDNGIGMNKGDLRKFGKYLASSKSLNLRQTRGSQGFGAPSAFSDAQNTTGRPIVAVSKTADMVYAIVSEFFTTSKNEKRYIIHPTEVDSQFLHGTYIKLHYLNVKYIRGYADLYVKETALMNPHVTIIFIDPYGEEWIYPRLVSSFPKEPKYAKPHPSSTTIGDLQDLLAKSENQTISAFLQENFVRISAKTARQIIKIAERNLQDKKGILILKNGYITVPTKKNDELYFLRYEKRIFGKSKKPRDKLIAYTLKNEELLSECLKYMEKYQNLNKELDKINNEIKKLNRKFDTIDTKKEKKALEKVIDQFLKKIENVNKQKEDIKIEIDKVILSKIDGLIEVKKANILDKLEKNINEILISKARPSELTNDQFNSLFHAFKSIKYMAPPTDTAIPVGETVLENTLIKEIGLKISDKFDDFDTPIDKLHNISELIESNTKDIIVNKDNLIKKRANYSEQDINSETIVISSKILSNFEVLIKDKANGDVHALLEKILNSPNQASNGERYKDIFEFFEENYNKDDDFVSAETRPPTSGKGLAYVVEAALAYCNDPKRLDTPKRSRDVLSRFVNRTPKLRDSADCAITKAVQSVNWKNYKLDTFDNNLPKGPIKLLVNVSGPFVHLMFKSQSKNALADDEDLIREIKYCLEAIGRRLRVYLNRKATIKKREKRASLIEKYIPIFVKSVYNIAKNGNSKFKNKISLEEMEELMRQAVRGKKVPEMERKEKEIIKEIKPMAKPQITVEHAVEHPKPVRTKEFVKKPKKVEKKMPAKVRATKEIIEKTNLEIEKELVQLGTKKESIAPVQTKEKVKKAMAPEIIMKKEEKKESVQLTLPVITTEKILNALSDDWQNIKHLIFKLKIKDTMDARYLQSRLKDLVRKGKVEMQVIKNKKHWRLIKGD